MDYRREIDGLRAVAVLPVILFHAGFESLSGGFVGVDVFFVISGYLITSIILSEKKLNTFSLLNFYERRARRILPALFVVMLVCLPFAWFWLLPSDMKSFSQSLVAVSVFSSNLLFWQTSGYFDSAAELKPLLHTWSLAVEEQYYLFFPVLLLLVWRVSQRWIIPILVTLGIASLVAASWGSVHWRTAAFYLLPTRGWELLIGALVAFYFSNDQRLQPSIFTRQSGSTVGVILITYAVAVFDKNTPYPSLYTLIPTIGTALIILFASDQTLVGRILGHKLLVGIGLISYSAYLWHQPLLAFARQRSFYDLGKPFLGVLALLSILLAYISWKYVEIPFRDKKRFSRSRIFAFAVAGSALFMAFGLVGHFNKGYTGRFDDTILRINSAIDDRNPMQAKCHTGGAEFLSPESSCVLGSGPKVIGSLLGDSHADSLAHSLDSMLTTMNMGMRQLTYSGCPPTRGVYRSDLESVRNGDRCDDYNDAVYKYLTSNKEIHNLIFLARWPLYLDGDYFDDREGGHEAKGRRATVDAVVSGQRTAHPDSARKTLVMQRYKETIEQYLKAGKRIILIYPIPEVGRNVPSTLMKLQLFSEDSNLPFTTTSHAVFSERNRNIYETLDSIGEHQNLIRIKPAEIFCNTFVPDRCVTTLSGESLYYDGTHLSNHGARLIVNKIRDAIAN